MTTLPSRQTLSVEEYLEFDRNNIEARHEYIDGCVTMLAEESTAHATISFNMISVLHDLLNEDAYWIYTPDARVCLSESRYVYPDVTVSCASKDQGEVDIIQFPRLVVEVLSPDTEDYDRGRKFTFYRACPSLQEYVLINTAHKSIEVFRRERNDLWILQIFGPADTVELLNLDIRFPVSAAYEDVDAPDDDI